jgi:hypothetical protein
MTIPSWTKRAAALLALAVTVPALAAAQGVTTGAIGGTVRNTQGQPLEGAQIQVVNRSTGFTSGVVTRESGRYLVQGLEVGSNYELTVRRIGHAPQTHTGVRVTLSQVTPLDIALEPQAAQLDVVTIEGSGATGGAIISPNRTGAVTTVTDTLMARLPTLNRNFTDFVRLTPQVSTSGPGLSGGGTNNRYNSIQIDGATESDLFGLGSTGQPGGQAGGKSIAVESVKEYQVLLSPYDVRQGFFSGALINAVTKSGTNDFTGSAYYYGRNQSFTRSQPYISDFDQRQFGFSAGGPILRDRLLFFVNPEWQQRTAPASGNYVGRPTFTAITQADVDRFVQLLEARGMSSLGHAGQVTIENPLTNIFGRLDFNLGDHQVVLRHNYGHAEDDVFSRTTGFTPSFPLSSNGYAFTSDKNATVGQLRSQFGNGSFNELIVGMTTIRDRRAFLGPVQPQVEVGGFGGESISAGAERSSQANQLDQDIFEFTNNYTMPWRAHSFTVGTQNQFVKFRNLFGQNVFGRWRFNTMTDLEAGNAFEYLVGVPAQAGTDGSVRFSASTYSFYAQDNWAATPNLRLTFGLRADIPVFNDKPPYNVLVDTTFNRNTSEIPSGNLQWSPRFGFNWDVTGDRVNQLRGGIGMFTGRPAYVWLSNAFQNSGLSGVAQLVCRPGTGGGIPVFTAAAVATPPTQCLNGTGPSVGGEINLIHKDTKFPQNMRGTLGFDRDLRMHGLIATLEGVYTRGINSLFYRNLAYGDGSGVRGQFSQEGIGTSPKGRVVYGNTPSSPALAIAGRSRVIDFTNHNKDYSWSLTGGLTRRYLDNWQGSVFYTYSRSFDVQSLTSSTAGSQFDFGRVLSEAHSGQTLTPSRWDQPHRFVANGTYTVQRTRTDLSLIWIGESGARYSYVYNRDMNGDGVSVNDPIYVPADVTNPAEIVLTPIMQTVGGVTSVRYTVAEQQAALESFIQGAECLRQNRGRILPRNACSEPFTNRVDFSIRQSLPTFRGQSVSLALDVINFGNLLNNDWGRVPLAGANPVSLLTSTTNTLSGGTTLAAGGEPLWQFDPNRRLFDDARLGSNYQMQLSLRYSF